MTPKIGAKKAYVFHHPSLESDETAAGVKPKALGTIPKLAVLLGLLSPFYYELYKKCDGKKTVSELAEEFGESLGDMRKYIDKLYKNGLVSI